MVSHILREPNAWAIRPRMQTSRGEVPIRSAALRPADETLVAVEVVALAVSSEHTRLDRTRGSARQRSEGVDERLVHTDHIVALGAARHGVRTPLFVPVWHSCPGSAIHRRPPSGVSRRRSGRTTESNVGHGVVRSGYLSALSTGWRATGPLAQPRGATPFGISTPASMWKTRSRRSAPAGSRERSPALGCGVQRITRR
jgi:hypothetical protein